MIPILARQAVCDVLYPKEDNMALVPRAGQPAPDFELKSHDGRVVRLSDYRGKKNVVIAFFPLAWTPV
jgi:peroxiredoxin